MGWLPGRYGWGRAPALPNTSTWVQHAPRATLPAPPKTSEKVDPALDIGSKSSSDEDQDEAEQLATRRAAPETRDPFDEVQYVNGFDDNKELQADRYDMHIADIDIKFEFLICDEAYVLRDPRRRTPRACMMVNAISTVMITATPLLNQVDDIILQYSWNYWTIEHIKGRLFRMGQKKVVQWHIITACHGAREQDVLGVLRNFLDVISGTRLVALGRQRSVVPPPVDQADQVDIQEPQEDNEPLPLVKTAGQIAKDDIATRWTQTFSDSGKDRIARHYRLATRLDVK